MIGIPEAPRSWWSAQAMARAAGVPLARAVVEGWITRADLADMVLRCQTCPSGTDCTHWLAALRPETPAFCAIKPDIEALRAFS
ncbi:MAG: DUF6455 family protein [Gemmobacter sp.]